MTGSTYIGVVTDTIRRAYDGQTEVLGAFSALIAETVEKRRNVFVFGCTRVSC